MIATTMGITIVAMTVFVLGEDEDDDDDDEGLVEVEDVEAG
jgi:hypothetical protein